MIDLIAAYVLGAASIVVVAWLLARVVAVRPKTQPDTERPQRAVCSLCGDPVENAQEHIRDVHTLHLGRLEAREYVERPDNEPNA